MDFWIDIGAAALLRLLKDRRELRKYRSLFIKIAAAIAAAYASDESFESDVEAKVAGAV